MTVPMWSLSLKTAPATEPVTLTDVKNHLRVDDSTDDTLITALIQATREWIESYTNRALITQSWYLKLDGFPCGSTMPIWIPKPPLVSINSISYIDTNGNTQTWNATTGYQLSQPSGPTAQDARIQPAYGTVYPVTRAWNQFDAVTIDFTAGYGNATSVPASIRAAQLLLIGHWYEHREAVDEVRRGFEEIPLGVPALLGPYTVTRWT